MNNLLVGFSSVVITPPIGCRLYGYYVDRIADGVLDDLELRCLALSCNQEKAVILSADHGGICNAVLEPIAQAIAAAINVKRSSVFFHETHTHTATFVDMDSANTVEKEYYSVFLNAAVNAAVLAVQDLQPAVLGYAIGTAPNVAFCRRYRMKDGSVQTNPGVNNPDIVAAMGEVDERVTLLRFNRQKDTIALVSFGNHPDTVGGTKISADWPGFARRTIERALPGTKCLIVNGTQGDVNHVNVHPKGGDFNDLFVDFDDVSRGYGHTRHIGNVVAGGVLQIFDKVRYIDVDFLASAQRTVPVPANLPMPEQIPQARKIEDLHLAGRDSELPYQGMMLTTVVAEAERMLRLEHGPDCFQMQLSGINIGGIVLIGIPGEPFSGIGNSLKAEASDLPILVTCCTNGYEGYFPMQDAYDEGGYESRSSPFKAGVAELMIAEGKKLIASLTAEAGVRS